MLDLGLIQVLFLLFKHVKINTSSTVKELNVVQTKHFFLHSIEAFWMPVWSHFSFLFNMFCVCLLFVNPECHICLHGRGKLISPTLIRDQPLQMNPNKSHCEGNLKTSLRSGWESDFHQYHLHSSGNRISTRRTLVLAQKTRLLRRAKTNTPTLSTRHWGTDYEAVHKTNHVPRTDNNSETTLRTFKLWSPRRGFFLLKPKLNCMNLVFSKPSELLPFCLLRFGPICNLQTI